VVDERDVFVGIVRRRPVIECCARLSALAGPDVKVVAQGTTKAL